ncbi:MAG: hypothetical protein ACYCTB_08055 [bacterium]
MKNKIFKNNYYKFLSSLLLLYFYLFLLILLVFCIHSKTAYAQPYSNLAKYSFENRLYIHRLPIKSNIIYKLNTALGYVSIITLPCIPLNVAMGSASDFSEQIIGRQIFIKPITYNNKIKTNLEILTKYGLINILLKITKPEYVTYNLNLTQRINNIFIVNYIKAKIKKEKETLNQKYNKKFNMLKKEQLSIKKQKKEIMNLVLAVNRIKINKKIREKGLVLTIISLSRIGQFFYLQYQITNTTNSKFFIRNIYLYLETGEDFFNGYNPAGIREINIINSMPHNKSYMSYKIIRNVAIFKRIKLKQLKQGINIKFSVHILIHGKLIKLDIGNILN